jgi:hypothetical protein
MKKAALILLALCSMAMAEKRVFIAVTADETVPKATKRRLVGSLEETIVALKDDYVVITKNEQALDVVDNEIKNVHMKKEVRDDHIIKAGRDFGAQYAFIVEVYDNEDDTYDITARMVDLETKVSVLNGRVEEVKLKSADDREQVNRALQQRLLAASDKGIFLDESFKSDDEFIKNVRGLANFQAAGSRCGKGGIRVRVKLTPKGDKGCIINRGSEVECKMDINISGEQCDRSVNTMLRDVNAQVTGKGSNAKDAERDAYNKLRNFRVSCGQCVDGNLKQQLITTLRKWERGEQ